MRNLGRLHYLKKPDNAM